MKKEVAKAYAYLAMVRSDIDQENALLIANEFDFLTENVSEGEALKALQDAYQEADRYVRHDGSCRINVCSHYCWIVLI